MAIAPPTAVERDALRTVGFLLWPECRRIRAKPAADLLGVWVRYSAPEACAWCLAGAINLVSDHLPVHACRLAQLTLLTNGVLECFFTGTPMEMLIKWWDKVEVQTQSRLLRRLQKL
jgi:hypothetical protein